MQVLIKMLKVTFCGFRHINTLYSGILDNFTDIITIFNNKDVHIFILNRTVWS